MKSTELQIQHARAFVANECRSQRNSIEHMKDATHPEIVNGLKFSRERLAIWDTIMELVERP